MQITLDWVTFLPEWNENKTDPNPISMEIKPLTRADKLKYDSRLSFQMKAGHRNAPMISNQATLEKELFCDHVRNIKNFIISLDGKKIDANTPEQFLEYAPEELAKEVEDAYKSMSGLSEDQIKK